MPSTATELIKKTLPFILLITSLILGIIANYLLRVSPWGLNIPLLMAIFVAVTTGIVSWRNSRQRTQENLYSQKSSISIFLLLSILIFSICFIIRASFFMQALCIFVIFVCLLLLSTRMSDRDFLNFSFEDIFLGSGRSLILLPFAPLMLLVETQWSQLKFRGKDRTNNLSILLPLIRGLVIAIPIFIIFAMLFSSADQIFGEFFNQLFTWNLNWNIEWDTFISHVISIGFFSYCFAAILRNTLLGQDWYALNTNESTAANFLQLGVLELYLILGSLSVLFISFLIVQFRYLFGGTERILGTKLTYAEYGRSGFFELVTVALFLNILLLLLLWLTKKTSKAQSTFKFLASVIIILLFGVIVSAYKRLSLYIDAYGLTEDRFYSMTFIFFLGILMLFFLCKLFIKRTPSLASGYIILGMLAVFNLLLLNPDRQIAKVNIDRSITQAKSLDIIYLSRDLSQDIIPLLLNYFDSDQEIAKQLSPILWTFQNNVRESQPWRSWNFSKWQTNNLLNNISENTFTPPESIWRNPVDAAGEWKDNSE